MTYKLGEIRKNTHKMKKTCLFSFKRVIENNSGFWESTRSPSLFRDHLDSKQKKNKKKKKTGLITKAKAGIMITLF